MLLEPSRMLGIGREERGESDRERLPVPFMSSQRDYETERWVLARFLNRGPEMDLADFFPQKPVRLTLVRLAVQNVGLFHSTTFLRQTCTALELPKSTHGEST